MAYQNLERKAPFTVKKDLDFMSRITRDERICGGEPIIRSMRITVRAIVEYMEIYQSKEEILRALPDLTLEDIDAALAYYDQHHEEIERYRQEEEESENWTDVPNLFKR
jgi:uncharacterized protein (DUF433 family)